jgi:Fe-S cluster biogenesis protein NfuA
MPEHTPDFQKRLESIEHLLGTIDRAADPNLRATVQQIMQLIMDLHGAGVERMLELIRATGDGGANIVSRMGRDELVGSLLVLYGLHPVTLEGRVAQALDKVSSRLLARNGEVELLSIRDCDVRLRLNANGQGCGSTPQALKEMVEEAVYGAAPDVTSLIIEGAEEKQGFVPLEMLRVAVPAPRVSEKASL